MEANAGLRSGQVGLKVSAVFFGVFGVVTALLSLAPGAPAPLWVLLRMTSVIFALAALGIGARKAWATIPGIAAGALGVLAALVVLALVPVFIFPEALGIFAIVLLAGSSFALYAVLLDRRHQPIRRSLGEEAATLLSSRLLVPGTLVVLGIFVLVPLLGAVAWSLYGCSGRISDVLCL